MLNIDKDMNNNPFLHFIKKERGKKIDNILNNLAIFLFAISILSGFSIQNLMAFGQNNQTSSLNKNDFIQSIPAEDIGSNSNQDIKQNVSNNTSSNFISSNTANNQQSANNVSNITKGNTGILKPDMDCLFDPSLPKCAPNEKGQCPDDFGMNEDGQCFPLHERCPQGYHSHEDDESGKCIPDNIPCELGYIMNPSFPECQQKQYVCQEYPTLKACNTEDKKDKQQTRITPYESGYNHGCDDAKTSDPADRYINQPSTGPAYHTNEFMSGYYDGFDMCSNITSSFANSK